MKNSKLAFFYFPQCLLICSYKCVQLYLESVFQLPYKFRSIWSLILLTILSVFSLIIGIIHITFVFTERILFSWILKPQKSLIVYIIGAPRSGTTRLHKLIASNDQEFTAMKMWELFFAPSIIQKMVFSIVGKIDGFFNSIFSTTIKKAERTLFSKFNNIHPLSLFNVEEDALVLFHLFYTYHLSFLLGTEKSYSNLNRDKHIPKAIWVYYKFCIENHQIQNPEKIYLSKNPFFTAHSNRLESVFPAVKFINISRDIEEVSLSFFSMKKHLSNVFYGCNPSQQKYKEILVLLKYWQESGAKLKGTNSIQVDYMDMKEKPSAVIKNIYNFLSLDLNKSQQALLLQEDENSKNYISKHRYKAEEFIT